MKKQRNFLDMFFDVIMEIKSPHLGREEKVDIVRHFLETLPNIMLAEVDILPPGVYLKGAVTTCSPEQYLQLSEKERKGKKIDFEFKKTDRGVALADIYRGDFFSYTGMWDEAIERLIDEIAPGDRALRLGLAEGRFFHKN